MSTLDLNDDEWMESRRMIKELDSIICDVSNKQTKYKSSYKRLKADSYKRFWNPIACSKCILCSTCMKRIEKGLTKCPNGIQKKVKKAA